MRLPHHRWLSALFTLLYLLAAGGETVQHAWAEPVSGVAETHLHGEREDHGCPPAVHDELHCPACKLAGLRTLPASSLPALAAAPAAPRVVSFRTAWAPSARSHAPPASRAPPLFG